MFNKEFDVAKLEKRLVEAEGHIKELCGPSKHTWLYNRSKAMDFLNPDVPTAEPLFVSRSQQRRLAIQKSPPRDPDQPERKD